MEKKANTGLIVQWLVSICLPVAVYFLIPRGEVLTEQICVFLAVTLWGVLAWMFELLPPFVVGLLITLGYILTKVTTAEIAFSSWNNQMVWLTFSGLLVGTAFERTGLLKRIDYFCIRRTGYSYRGIVIGLILSGVIITLILPNLSARVTLYAFLGIGICEAMKLEKGSKAGAGIMLASFLAAVGSRYLLPSGNDETVMAHQLMENPPSIQTHAIANAPITLVWVVVIIAMILVLFQPKDKIDCRSFIDEEWNKLGKLAGQEIKFLVMLVVALILAFTNTIALGWCFLLLACCCFLPGIDILKGPDMMKTNFGMVIFVACAMTIGNVATSLNLGAIVSNACIELLGSVSPSQYVLFPRIWLFGVLVNFLMTPLAAVSSFTVPVVGVATATGLSVNAAVYSFTLGVEQVLFPYEWAATLFVFSFGYITSKQFLKFGAVRMALNLIFLLALAIPYWNLVGFA